MEKYNMNDPKAAEIRKKVETMRALYDDDDIELYDVIAIEEVRKFEAAHAIRLPDDYVWFITNVGNGGMWHLGEYMFYPLDQTYFCCEDQPDDPFGGTKDYSLSVLSMGCSYAFGIILKGEHFGEISSNAESTAKYRPEMQVYSFVELILKWLNEGCLYYHPSELAYRNAGTIEENLAQYQKEPDFMQIWSIYQKLPLLQSQRVSEQFITNLHDTFVAEKQNKHRLLLAKILLRVCYADMDAVLESLMVPENYDEIVLMLYFSSLCIKGTGNSRKPSETAVRYYPMLLRIMKYCETTRKPDRIFQYCFEMTVLNPAFHAKDIEGILTSDAEDILYYLANGIYQKDVKERIGMYIENAEPKYAKQSALPDSPQPSSE